MFKHSTHPQEIRFIHKMNQVRKNRLLGYKFRRQFAIDKYIVDFICCDQKLHTIRFSNAQVFNQTKSVLDAITSCLK